MKSASNINHLNNQKDVKSETEKSKNSFHDFRNFNNLNNFPIIQNIKKDSGRKLETQDKSIFTKSGRVFKLRLKKHSSFSVPETINSKASTDNNLFLIEKLNLINDEKKLEITFNRNKNDFLKKLQLKRDKKESDKINFCKLLKICTKDYDSQTSINSKINSTNRKETKEKEKENLRFNLKSCKYFQKSRQGMDINLNLFPITQLTNEQNLNQNANSLKGIIYIRRQNINCPKKYIEITNNIRAKFIPSIKTSKIPLSKLRLIRNLKSYRTQSNFFLT